MEKKQASGRLPTMEDAEEQDVPSELIELGLQYQRAQKQEAKAKGTTKDLFVSIKDKMQKLQIEKFRVEIDGKKRWLKLDKTEKIKWEYVKPKKLAPNEIQ